MTLLLFHNAEFATLYTKNREQVSYLRAITLAWLGRHVAQHSNSLIQIFIYLGDVIANPAKHDVDEDTVTELAGILDRLKALW